MKIGILGTGRIAHSVTPTLAELEQIECYAVASRTREKADCFARQYGFEKAYGSYEELLRDPEVELVYVATPHSHHWESMMRSMELGKPVLCEKAFTLNSRQAKEVRAYGSNKRRRGGEPRLLFPVLLIWKKIRHYNSPGRVRRRLSGTEQPGTGYRAGGKSLFP